MKKAFLIALVFAARAVAAPTAALTGDWQLFIDDELVAHKEDVLRVYHAFEKYAGNPVLIADKPWEGKTAYVYGTVLPSERDDGLRMWYHCWAGGEYRMVYAKSADGVKWDKPELGLVEYEGKMSNNILFRRTKENHNPQVIFTPDEEDFTKRYKMLYFEYGRTPPMYTVPGYRGAYSPDGLHWTDVAKNPVLPDDPGDVGNFVWDPLQERFLGYPKKFEEVRGFRRRCVGYSSTKAFENWPATQTVIVPDEFDDRWVKDAGQHTDFYGLCGFPYQNMYLGFLWIFRITDGKNDGPIFVELVSSRDGLHWKRQDEPRTPILALGENGAWDDGMLFTTNHPLIDGDHIKLYYGGFDGTHGVDDAAAGIGLATLRKDGFASLDAGEVEGTVTTKLLMGVKGALRVNAAVTGGLRVELLDERDLPVPGYGIAECDPVKGNGVDLPITWGNAKEVPVRATPVRVRFHLKNASVYSFRAGEKISLAPAQ